MLLLYSSSVRTCSKGINGVAVNDGPSHQTRCFLGSHLHFSGHRFASLPGTITNHVANSSDTNTAVSLDGMASCCNLHIERN